MKVISILLVIALVACHREPEPIQSSLIGKWPIQTIITKEVTLGKTYIDTLTFKEAYFEFADNGHFSFFRRDSPNSTGTDSGTYSLSGQEMTLVSDSQPTLPAISRTTYYAVQLEGSKLIMRETKDLILKQLTEELKVNPKIQAEIDSYKVTSVYDVIISMQR